MNGGQCHNFHLSSEMLHIVAEFYCRL